MSATEKIALEAGDVWIEKEVFCGDITWQTISEIRKPELSSDEQSFLDDECHKLCELLDDFKHVEHDKDLSKEVWQFIKEKGFFGISIPKSYGGLGFSAYAHSQIVLKIATRSISAAVTIMVPNSLGPGELLMRYGTKAQKDTLLPKLAVGKEVPCFALTAPNAGSDATSLTDRGEVITHEGKLAIKLSWKKRYITLAPVATLIGVAFKLYDPNHLLELNKEDIGITLALIPANHPGVKPSKRHSPLGLAFMNGTTEGENVIIPLDWIVGGVDMVGEGWKMLMECLSIGRSISLPALAVAAAKQAYMTTGVYAHLREQFGCAIGVFEGVQMALGRIGGLTYLMDAVRIMTADAVGQDIKPSLVSAITKYHLTEMARVVINDAMDVHAGRGIQYGPSNYLGYIYQSLPMSITVEGANILTRNLIIFGQGAMRCHPFLVKEMEAVADNPTNKLKEFDAILCQHVHYTFINAVKAFVANVSLKTYVSTDAPKSLRRYFKILKSLSYALAFISDVTFARLGGSLKRKEALSARLGDILSHLYMATCVMKYFTDNGESKDERPYLEYALSYCFHEAHLAFDAFFANFPDKALSIFMKRFTFPLGVHSKPPSDELHFNIAKSMQSKTLIREKLSNPCFNTLDKEDSIGKLLYPFELSEKVTPIVKRIKEAQKDKILNKKISFEELINQALVKEVITDNEKERLWQYELARQSALNVDEFDYKQ